MVGTHHCSKMNRRAEAIIAPHSGEGGCAPIPRNPSPAAVKMIPLISSVTRTTRLGKHSGATCRSTIRPADAPVSRTAAMKSAPRKLSVSARASRA